MLELLFDPNAWVAFATLTALEIVLGIDNIIFIAILVRRLPYEQQGKARQVGLILAMGMRILLLFSLVWIMKLTAPIFTVFAQEISGRDLILIGGGLFLLAKSTMEIHHSLEGAVEKASGKASITFLSCVVQIGILDIVFSLDSVITAIGLAEQIEVMVAAIVVAVLVMMLSARSISQFVDRHPTIRMLALSFLILIGMALIGEGADFHIPKGYIYFAMAFSVSVEMLNIRARKLPAEPVHLRKAMEDDGEVETERESGALSAGGGSHRSDLPGSAPDILQRLLPYNGLLDVRRLPDVDMVVIHCTELPSLELSREFGERIVYQEAGTGNSGHFYIDTDGRIWQWVELERVAHHVRGMNRRSVGIELVNPGRYPDWFRSDRQTLTDPYPSIQITALKALLRKLESTVPSLAWLAGHEELDTELISAVDAPDQKIRRKVDPGPLFPWDEVASSVSLSRWEMESLHG